MNEEELKVQYILPWLQSTGIHLSDLQLEQTFSVKIGRNAVPVVGHDSKKKAARGRLDILVQHGGRNLFIVETKAPDESLSDDDRDQAISYARLVHPIAPYAVVTNGKEYRLFNSISKEEVKPSDVQINGFDLALPLADLEAAQRFFLGLSTTNLVRFCKQQVASQLSVIKGSLSERRKYVPQLHVARASFQAATAVLYSSNSAPGLLVVGQSGSGKTCEMCALADSLLSANRPVLFFNGFSLIGDVPDAIACEFAWTFGGSDSAAQVVKRIESFLGRQTLTIIVDAVDEWRLEGRAHHLASFLRAIQHLKIKVMLTCKSSAVEQFVLERGNPTHLTALTKQVEFSDLTSREFYKAVDKYREAYGFHGGIESAVLTQARENLFFLRVVFEVVQISKLKNVTFSSGQLFDEYYRQVLNRTRDPAYAQRTLEAIAALLYERDADAVSEADVRNALGLRISESLMEELFEFNLLVRAPDAAGEQSIAFYFQQLRDYVVAFKVRKFAALSDAELLDEFNRVKFPGTRGDVFTLFYRLAQVARKKLFDGELRENATAYLDLYVKLIEDHFPSLKRELRPGTDQRIGFIGELMLARGQLGGYGFRAIGPVDEEVHLFPVQKVLDGSSSLAMLEGAGQMHLTTSAKGFRRGIDVREEVVNFELVPQIKSLIERGGLNESGNMILLTELAIELVEDHPTIFRKLLRQDRSIRYPLDLNAVRDSLLRAQLDHHFEDQIVKRKISSGEIREFGSGDYISYSYHRTPEDTAEIERNVERAMKTGVMPTLIARLLNVEEIGRWLLPAVDRLRTTCEHIAAPPFGAWSEIERQHMYSASAQPLAEYIRAVCEATLPNYRTLLDINFPTLKEFFPSYSSKPKAQFIELGPPLFPKNDRSLRIFDVESDANKVSVVGNAMRRSEEGMRYEIDDEIYEPVAVLSTTVRRFLEGARSKFGRMHLRAQVYDLLLREWPIVQREFQQRARSV